MGANDDIFIPQLLEFGSKFVDSRVRQLALLAFAEVNKVHLKHPRVKIAMIMRAYRKQPNNAWCPFPERRWASWTNVRTMHKLEALLRYFQLTCKPAVAGMQALKRVQLTANVAAAAADAFIMCKHRENENELMMSAVTKYFDEIKLFAEQEGLAPPRSPKMPDLISTK